jgi:hypothetical protein
MNRILPLLSSVAFCVAASAQCFETNFGTQIGLGDDTLLAAQAIGFNFPMAGVNHTHIIPNTNGAAFLHTAATGALGITEPAAVESSVVHVSPRSRTAASSPSASCRTSWHRRTC